MGEERAKVLPVYFGGRNEREVKEYELQLGRLKELYGDTAEFLDSVCLGNEQEEGIDAIVIPQLFGVVFQEREKLKAIRIPLIILTSEFGTVEMWDWEIAAWLRDDLKLNVFFPYNTKMAKVIFRSLAVKRAMRTGRKFLMFQDNPGEGMQAYLFKKFYWWDKNCTESIEQAFGIKIFYRSYKELNEKAEKMNEEKARQIWEKRRVPFCGLSERSILRSVKLYMAIKAYIEEIGEVHGVGCNCLNESFLSSTTPCLAWNWIYEYDHIIWACEGDTLSMLSKYMMYSALKCPMMMTNIYPFLIGMAALKHEKIQVFPDIKDPENHALGVHCGYFGFAPQSFCSKWTLKPKVLEIVNEDAVAVDCEFEAGPITMAKLRADMKKITIIEAEIESYVQYPGSDCCNGALIKYKNRCGHIVMEKLSSHHAILLKGDVSYLLVQMARVYEIEWEIL